MPPKKGTGKGKDNDKKKKKTQGISVDAAKVLKELIKEYDVKCEHYFVGPCIPIRRQLKMSMDENKLLHRFLIDPKDRRKVDYWEDEQLTQVFAPIDASVEAKSLKKKQQNKPKKEPQLLVKVLPLLEALRNKRYIHIQELLIWEVLMEYDDIMALAGMFARSIYQFVRVEIVDCFINAKCLSKLAPTINLCRTLQEIVFDFNEFGDKGCMTLCQGLAENKWLLHLSLCYCDLTNMSGAYLGELICKTPIRELFLDGNELQAEGVIALLDMLSQGAVLEAQERLERKRLKEEQETIVKGDSKIRYNIDVPTDSVSEVLEDPSQTDVSQVTSKSETKGKKSKKKSKNSGAAPPPSGPQISKLRLADNGIDQMGRGGNFAPMKCMQILKTIIANSIDLEEIDLFGNDVGDLGSRQLLDGLIMRKANKLPQIGIRVGHRINQDTFDMISKMAPGAKKKKGKAKKKK